MQLQVDSDTVASTNVAKVVIINGGNFKFRTFNRFVATLQKLESLKSMKSQLRKCLHKICLQDRLQCIFLVDD